jgi:hypothetical protein
MSIEALEQRRDNVLRYGDSVGGELIKCFVRLPNCGTHGDES